MEVEYCDNKNQNHSGKRSKKCSVKISPKKGTFSANFTGTDKFFYVVSDKCNNMKKELYLASKKHNNDMPQELDQLFGDSIEKVYIAENNPTYEDPRDIIGEIPVKPPRKHVPREGEKAKSGKTVLREQKKKLSKKYENLIMSLMDRCEENCVQISEKETHIAKLKEKLKAVLDYNKLFAEENDRLRAEQESSLRKADEWNARVQDLENRNKDLEDRCRELREKLRQIDVPDKDEVEGAVPLVQVCMSCSSRHILLARLKDQNSRMHADMMALKDVLYRLNIQLSKYQQKLRESAARPLEGDAPHRASDAFDSLITASLTHRPDGDKNRDEDVTADAESTPTKMANISGLLSAQALAPLFTAYQDNIEEKENLIHDYEKQFETINMKLKQMVTENKSFRERVDKLEQELLHLSKRERVLCVEKETLELEKQTLMERAEKAEVKLKETYEMYEDKMSALFRDYETVHRELSESRAALSRVAGTQRRSVPADLHERRVAHCQRLLEELKHQYSMETERKTDELHKLQDNYKSLQDKYDNMCKEHDAVKEELSAALKNVRLYRKAAVIFRQRSRASHASSTAARKLAARNKRPSPALDPLTIALSNLHRIKEEVKIVKCRAQSSLSELECRMRGERAAAAAARRDLERAHLLIRHKEDIINNLLDRVADVEELRLSQTHNQRLQGIVVTSPESSPKEEEDRRKEKKTKLVPSHGGYYQDTRRPRSSKEQSPSSNRVD